MIEKIIHAISSFFISSSVIQSGIFIFILFFILGLIVVFFIGSENKNKKGYGFDPDVEMKNNLGELKEEMLLADREEHANGRSDETKDTLHWN